MSAYQVTIQGGWLDGRVIAIPAGRHEVVVLEEPPAERFTTIESAELLSHTLRLPLEHIAENHYLARWPVREDPRYCPQCACPPAAASRAGDIWACYCRFNHGWTLHRRNLKNYPPSAWPAAIRERSNP